MIPIIGGFALSLIAWIHRNDSTGASPWLAIVALLVLGLVAYPPRSKQSVRAQITPFLPLMVALNLIALFYFRNATGSTLWIQNGILFQLVLVISSRYLPEQNGMIPVTLVLVAEIIKLAVLLEYPNPPIDTFSTLQEGINLWLKTQNPYLMDTLGAQPGQDYGYVVRLVYWPINLLFNLPAKLLLDDVRYTYWIFDLLIALGLGFLCGRRPNGQKSLPDYWMMALWATLPATPFLLRFAWTDPLNVGLTLIAVCLLMTKKKPLTTGFFVALACLSKLYVALPLILVICAVRKDLFTASRFWWGTLPPIAFTLSFLYPKPEVVLSRWFEVLGHPMRLDSLSVRASGHYLASWAGVVPQWDSPFWTFALSFALLGTAYATFQSKRLSRALTVQALGLGFIFLSSKQAFTNYYYFIVGLLFIAHAVSSSESGSSEDNPAFLSR